MKIGIITMHRVQNIGSVLQAYALQYKLEQLGHNVELIDYIFPPRIKKRNTIRIGVRELFNSFWGFPEKKRIRKLDDFRRKYLHCSSESYSRERIMKYPPQYDLYCTGSDQVWNSLHIGKDTTFMLDFAPKDKPRIAYASSFATNNVEEPYFSLYSTCLSKYSGITVREQYGVDIVHRMTGKEATVVCDPTLLLTDNEWNTIANDSDVNLSGGYILVYLLSYMFNPRPGFNRIVNSVHKTLELPVYYFNGYLKDTMSFHVKSLRGQGPADFVKLIKNAKFLITDSFHGVAFATLYNVPVIGVVKDTQMGDGRIATLRAKVDGKASIVCPNAPFSMSISEVGKYNCNPKKTEDMRLYSLSELKKMVDNCVNN